MTFCFLDAAIAAFSSLGRYLPESGVSCCGFEAAFCCAALVLPDDTCADAAMCRPARWPRRSPILSQFSWGSWILSLRFNGKQRAPGRGRSTSENRRSRIKSVGCERFAGGEEAARSCSSLSGLKKAARLLALFQRAADATRKSCGDSDDAVRNLQAEGRQGPRRRPVNHFGAVLGVEDRTVA